MTTLLAADEQDVCELSERNVEANVNLFSLCSIDIWSRFLKTKIKINPINYFPELNNPQSNVFSEVKHDWRGRGVETDVESSMSSWICPWWAIPAIHLMHHMSWILRRLYIAALSSHHSETIQQYHSKHNKYQLL